MFRPPSTTHIILDITADRFPSHIEVGYTVVCLIFEELQYMAEKSSHRELKLTLHQVILIHFKAQIDMKSVVERSSLVCLQMIHLDDILGGTDVGPTV